ncbi:macrolide transport system ATP-binding/permease protein [Breoghania corrubedonensis]|uniref:Pyoverdine export ATP-binding/permease protein PvdT n=1 Tax=Breoghania corrubedonensis TaxID=665038 RepID=A0A2T5UYI6_9HYPH|nr:MacB family efflux pump subunit [Breoghania corrubedonensis]PTW56552.1 macrolide transport system ATP-binding/permease protein [Breoghania corrubedonensis]
MSEPLIQLHKLNREFPAGESMLRVLDDVDLTIEAGEFVAIIGASGSGKSTLMNILGCLDRPSGGSYRVSGRETSALEPDELAALRREHFGFIFQRYHLLSELTALANTEIPAIYAGQTPAQRQTRAAALLGRLGMSDRLDHRPGQLSGGQQQRVSIARAMMNGADVILADEPTGALDTHSSEEVLRILRELHDSGKTVIIVTHDPGVAALAERTIEISDGRIVSDKRSEPSGNKPANGDAPAEERRSFARVGSWRAQVDRFREAFKMALRSMRAHKVRTFLTMLGIIIGIASVVSVVALGTGSQQKVLANISSLGTNTLEIFPGKDFGDVRSGKITTLVISDANQLAKQPYVAAVTPTVTTTDTIRFGSQEANAQVNGVGAQYFEAKGTKLAQGRLFDADSVRDMTQEVVIDENTRKTLFDNIEGSPVGRVILVGDVFCRIIGVTEQQQGGFGASNRLSVYLPYTTVQARFLGDQTLRSITVRVAESTETDLAEQLVTTFLTQRHGSKDFFILNTDDIRKTITSTTQTLALLIAAIAVISLVVGGIGVMNIMLVSVSERVSEIGVRMAVGARQSDILQQFLIEAVLVCLIGGVLGILAALGFGALFSLLGSSFQLIYSTSSIVLAFVSSSLIGIVFGYLPARNASMLDPVVALSRD